MDADERLTALKRAYADIILNTAKEAAARIMVSERKAIRFEYELKNAKEDAVQMLLRLKQMMDFKINEAERVSCTQQKKIEELEAQLQEAEDIVKDLREELRAVQAELERFPKCKDVKHTVQVNDASTENVAESITFSPLEVKPDSDIDQMNISWRLYSSLFPLKKSLIGKVDLPSIILRSKETELYRNGCTQRIRACERTPLDNDDGAREKLRKTPSNGADIQCNVEEKEVISDQVKETDLAADNSCLTSPNSVKYDTAIEGNCDEGINSDKDLVLVRACDSQSTIGEEPSQPGVKACETSGAPSQPVNDRVIRYTFQRKRKRGVLSLTDGNGSTVRNVENPKACFVVEKANSLGESTPEKIRLEQVARQLISLSDQKW